MVGIVFVSHSAKIAEGVKELANQMAQGKVPLAAAGGIDDPENPIGTDAVKVYEAIESIYSDDGVIVLMDLGSALLSAEMALEFLHPEKQANVFLSPAPFVEGALTAVVQAALGGSLEDVSEEARSALTIKIDQLKQPKGVGNSTAPGSLLPAGDQESLRLIVNNRLGLHARPAAQFVTIANKYAAEIQVAKSNRLANAKSINQMMMLGVRQGDEIQISAIGGDALDVLAELKALIDDRFGEYDNQKELSLIEPAVVSPILDGTMAGIPASPGVAVGPVVLFQSQLPPIAEKRIDDPAAEWSRFEMAVANVLQEINALQVQARRQIGMDEAAIFAAHALFLQDPVLLEALRNKVFSELINVEAAWDQALSQMVVQLEALNSTYMQARAADIEDVGRRVLRELLGVKLPVHHFEQPSILLAADFSPSDMASLDPNLVLGICTAYGGATSHSMLLARALGIPAIVGMGSELWSVEAGCTIGIDGELGRMWPQPNEAHIAELRELSNIWRAAQDRVKIAALEPALTRDGHQIAVAANISGPNDVTVALEFGAEGLGLFRTEFLFMDREEMPSEEEQVAVYTRVARAMRPRPLIIRTLDVGGDKPLPYVDLGEEANPFLGRRGIRFCLDQPELFKPQLKAILRAGSEQTVKIMFPMISSVLEIRAAKAMLADAQTELRRDGIPFDKHMEIGIMIEVPAAVAMADLLAAEVAFFSIGTNDLTQYMMAADRGNSHVAELAQALQPAVLRMVKQTVEAAHANGVRVGMCGELAGNVLATALLVGLGLDELSMSAPAIPAVKEAIRGLTTDQAKAIANTVLTLDSVTAVVAYLAANHNLSESKENVSRT